MATSNSYDWVRTRDQIINAAYRAISVVDPTEPADASLIETGAEALNIIAKAHMGNGLNLWRREEATLFLVEGKQTYDLGPTGDHCTGEINAVRASTAGITEMRVAGVATDVTLEVDSTTGMAASDIIGIVQDDDTIHWTTISSVTDSDTVVIASGLTAASAIDQRVYHYTSKIQRPLRLLTVNRRTKDGIDTPISKIAEEEYQYLPQKGSQGKVNEFYYDPRRDTNGLLHLWVTADTVDDTVHFSYHRPVQDLDAAADNLDYPVEWYRFLKFALAYDLSFDNGVPLQERLLLEKTRDKAEGDIEAWDTEDGSVYFGIDNYR